MGEKRCTENRRIFTYTGSINTLRGCRIWLSLIGTFLFMHSSLFHPPSYLFRFSTQLLRPFLILIVLPIISHFYYCTWTHLSSSPSSSFSFSLPHTHTLCYDIFFPFSLFIRHSIIRFRARYAATAVPRYSISTVESTVGKPSSSPVKILFVYHISNT